MITGKGIRLGKIYGVTITLDYSWFIVFALFFYMLGSGVLPTEAQGINPVWYWLSAFATTLLFFASIIAHELSHALVARRNGITVNNITLFIIGGVAQMEDEPESPMIEFKMAIAGPSASLVTALLFFVSAQVADFLAMRLIFVALTYLWYANAVLAVFNLTPAFPMDGGRVFRALLWGWTRNLRRATFIASIVGQAFGWVLISLGVGSLLIPQLRAFASIWFAIIGWFVLTAARASYQQVLLRETLSHVPIRDVMNTRSASVPADTSVDHLMTDYLSQESAYTLQVERDGALLGVVSVEDVSTIPREQWASTLVSDITLPLAKEQDVHPNDDVWDAIAIMSHTHRDHVLVTENGHIEGIITRGAILRWLQTHTPRAMEGVK